MIPKVGADDNGYFFLPHMVCLSEYPDVLNVSIFPLNARIINAELASGFGMGSISYIRETETHK